MKSSSAFILGLLIGAWFGHATSLPGQSGKGPPAYLNGGMISSSTIGVIYGYVDDMDGCAIHAAGMNYYYQSDVATQKKIMESKGNAFCTFEAIK